MLGLLDFFKPSFARKKIDRNASAFIPFFCPHCTFPTSEQIAFFDLLYKYATSNISVNQKKFAQGVATDTSSVAI